VALELKELYWAAGFLEGEGCFSTHRSVCIAASQVTLEPLQRLQALLGGGVRGPYSFKTAHKSQPIWCWTLSGARGIAAVMSLYSLMSARRQTAIRKQIENWKIRKTRDPRFYRSRYRRDRGPTFTQQIIDCIRRLETTSRFEIAQNLECSLDNLKKRLIGLTREGLVARERQGHRFIYRMAA
jgi:hypothetical protein